MASLRVSITLDNIDSSIDANTLADIIENMIRKHTGLESRTSIFDNDGVATSNPINTYDTFRRVRRI